ncbi:hypothetical protein DND132_2834 [Pseudodesulfovibrio mercurii]|uniref:Uncharacterized protein n=1 Tax=Pseudodesulfovibrio mercurii TaxID=641491 RepID=F0JJD8_9BACT|nr:hypothetical protein [Pseudodesulfovibrio mercurii]EGB16037.1 hypothetical protein DND132_2834 [Pseudodesulfovibrio mercurii]
MSYVERMNKEFVLKIRLLIPALMLILCLASAALAAESGQAVQPAASSPVEECKAIPWGAPISAVEEITYSRTVGGVKYYNVNKVEPCGVFNIQGANVTYGFRQGKLYTVLVEIDKAKDVKQVVATLMDSYGLPDHKQSDGWDEYRWETDDLKVKLKSQFTTDRIKIGMYYKPLIPKE